MYRNKSSDTANEEWFEILTLTTRASITSELQLRLATADPPPDETDVNKALSAQDLQSLKKQDPFLSYAIPGVRDATVGFNSDAVDMHQVSQDGLRRNFGTVQLRFLLLKDVKLTESNSLVERPQTK
jgi:hypothetical protein